MRVQLLLVLTACIVNSGLISAKTLNQIENEAFSSKVNDESEVRGNVQNLFDAILTNNTKKTEIYHEILKDDEVKKQRAFDAMKEELLSARIRNAYKKINFYKKNDISENMAKRQVDKKEDIIESFEITTMAITADMVNNSEAERSYINEFGAMCRGWTRIAVWMSEGILQPKMMELCTKASKAAGENETVGNADLDLQGTLRFINTNFTSISSIYVVYCIPTFGDELDINGEFPDFHYPFPQQHHDPHEFRVDKPAPDHHDRGNIGNHPDVQPHENLTVRNVWYLTKGTRDDCVYYLHRYNTYATPDNEYILDREVCGLEEIADTLDW